MKKKERTRAVPLNLAEIGKSYVIQRVGGRDKEKHHLENLGFVSGQEVTLLSELHGYYVVCIKDTKIGIERQLAQKVILIAA